ncbi:hypothetical protein M422DRAFT_24414 [Sphaerobolus stellatus SS14]|nr:hypothetical protein M422DRAFT_24414 [Sphaerobolus stellatus SS14]
MVAEPEELHKLHPNALPAANATSLIPTMAYISAPDHEYEFYAPDYSEFHFGCGYCGRMLSQVRDTQPLPCYVCNCTHYCSPGCLLAHRQVPNGQAHRYQCRLNIDTEIDFTGLENPTKSSATWDLRKYGLRWHAALGDAVVAALNLHADNLAMERHALVVHLSYVPNQPYRSRRFRFSHAKVENLSSLAGESLNTALTRRATSTLINRKNGMVGCALVVLTCNVPGIGFIFYSTFVGPEPSVLVDPPSPNWQNILWTKLSQNGTR